MQRLRFEHPDVKVVVLRSGKDRVFCAGANIRMLAGSTPRPQSQLLQVHQRDAQFAMEDASAKSGQRISAPSRGTAAGGGYELALACDHIILADDGNSTVSLPELPLLAVLPGTGGLTRVTDKRKVRRDLRGRVLHIGRRAYAASVPRNGASSISRCRNREWMRL